MFLKLLFTLYQEICRFFYICHWPVTFSGTFTFIYQWKHILKNKMHPPAQHSLSCIHIFKYQSKTSPHVTLRSVQFSSWTHSDSNLTLLWKRKGDMMSRKRCWWTERTRWEHFTGAEEGHSVLRMRDIHDVRGRALSSHTGFAFITVNEMWWCVCLSVWDVTLSDMRVE